MRHWRMVLVYSSNCDVIKSIWGIGELHQNMMKVLQTWWKHFNVLNDFLQNSKFFDCFNSNLWFNYFKYKDSFYQCLVEFLQFSLSKCKKRKEERPGGEPETLWSNFWCSTPRPTLTLERRRKKKRRLLEKGKILMYLLQTMMKILHLMKLKI